MKRNKSLHFKMWLLFKKILDRSVLVLSCLIIFSTANSQPLKKFISKSYTQKEGLLSKLILDMAEDGNGFLWISSGGGLQRFDGTGFETIHPQKGLAEVNHISFFKLSNGNIWLRYEDGISVFNAASNSFKTIYTVPKIHTNNNQYFQKQIPYVPFVELKSSMWCWDPNTKKFVSLNTYTGNIVDSLILPALQQPSSYRHKKGTDNTIYFDASFGDIIQVDFNKKQIKHIYHTDLNSFHESYTPVNYIPVNNNDLIVTTDKAIYRTDVTTGATTLLCNYPAPVSKHIFNTSLTNLHDSLFSLSINNQLFILNAVTGKIICRMVDEHNDLFIKTGYIKKCITSRYNHLWVISDAEGLKKINLNNLDIKYYGAEKPRDNFTRCIYPDKKNNLVITGTLFNGFFVFDTLQHLVKHFTLKFREQAGGILKVQPGKYLFFTDGDPGVYLFNAETLQLTGLNPNSLRSFIPHEVTWFTAVQPLNDTTAALFCNACIYIINYSNDNIAFTRIPVLKNYSAAVIDHKNRLWLSHDSNYSILTGRNFGHENIFYLPGKTTAKCFYQDAEKDMWIGTEKGLYKINGETGALLHTYREKDGLANDSIYSIINDDKGNLWCGTDRGISCIYKNGKIINLFVSDGLQSDKFNMNSCAKSKDGELFFGGINGVNSFYPAAMRSLREDSRLLITNIKLMDTAWNNDTAPWNMQEITLPYTQNVLSFFFTVLSRFNPEIYSYQYKMTGVDKEWINAGDHGYARYILPPGKYTFEYTAAGNEFERNMQHKFISITITPPFWRTTWFIILIAVCVIAIVIMMVNFYNRIINRKKLRVLEIQRTVQQERERISRDLHDNIGAYTTVLIASAEKLNRQASGADLKKSAENVSENAKNIMGSLQETIWVLNNNAITITDFIDRFKLYAKKILHNFPGVDIKFNEQLDKDFALSPAEALNLFRILQEALLNALKHAMAEHITVSVISNATIHISVKDNGAGFNTQNIVHGNGLYNMQYRAKESGYDLNIHSTAQGTEVTIQKISKA